jgi:hypothetical protein
MGKATATPRKKGTPKREAFWKALGSAWTASVA